MPMRMHAHLVSPLRYLLPLLLWMVALPAFALPHTYVPDPTFNGGNFYEDAFAGDSTQLDASFEGGKIVRLANGDVVLAAVVRHPYASVSTDGAFELGFVRYNAAGVRVPWPNPQGMNATERTQR